MASADKDSKTEEATPRKRNKEFSEGNFARSSEVGTTFILAIIFVVLVFFAKVKASELGAVSAFVFSHLDELDISETAAQHSIQSFLFFSFSILFPILSGCFLAAIAGGGVQSGFKPTPKAFKGGLKRMNPASGFKKLVNLKQNFIQLGVDLLKFTAMGLILFSIIREIINDPIFSVPVPLPYLPEFIFRTFLVMLSRLILAMAIIALIDYLWQRHKTNENMKMTKDEVKDERKDTDGNPEIKRAQRRFAIKILQQSMLKQVPDADVVVTNPTHFAVALKYERGVDAAPVMLAKGQDHFARKIKAVAKQHGVPMVENRPVARLLYRAGQVGSTIPVELYQVIAQILAKVYRTHRYYFHQLNARRARERAAKPTRRS